MRLIFAVLLTVCQAAHAGAKSDFDTLFGEKVKRVTATAATRDDADLGAEILEAAGSVSDMPELRLLMLEKALELACRDSSGFATAQKAAAELIKAAPKREAEWREILLSAHRQRYARSRGADKQRAGEGFIDQLVMCADAKVADAKASDAISLYRQAESVARVVRSSRQEEIRSKIAAATSLVATENRLKAMEAALKKDPKDVEARRGLALVYLLDLDDPKRAGALLTPECDEDLRRHVPLAAKPLEEIDESQCLELARWYNAFFDKPPSAAARATACARTADYYRRYLDLHKASDVERLKAKVKLRIMEDELARLGPLARKIRATGPIPPAKLLTMLNTAVTGREWRVKGEAITGRTGSIDDKGGKIFMKEAFQARAFDFGFKMMAGRYQGIMVKIDDQLYYYSRGHWGNTGGFILSPEGPDRHRGREMVTEPKKWALLQASLKNDVVVFKYNGEVTARLPVRTNKGGAHKVQVGFGSHMVPVAVKDFTLRKR